MFKTCIYCNRSLGRNDVVENFPVGRRLAYDQSNGRLWVICEVCRRWNLSPLDERWEAIEECERQFYDTSQSFSTDNIGLARLAEGLELVRIGKPRRPEFAAWRYGREFLRRRIRTAIITGAQVAISVAASLAGADIFWFFIFGGKKRIVARVHDDEGTRLCVVRKDLDQVRLARDDTPDGWSLRVPYRPVEKIGFFTATGKGKRESAVLSGPTAVRAAGHILPKVNSWGGTDTQVRAAVTLIEEARSPERLFERVAAERDAGRRRVAFASKADVVKKMDANVRLALEMAAHEESERRALEGELAILEQEWREAEEIASIADRLLIPESVENWIRRQKEKLAQSNR
ncbi:MAG: hypothetical protein AMS25_01440 [Gemmatimonas sp. SM23_52]|nr:MAG: hypothetical protein AMS25_01440 [Gemmatimonas sp. SM23_52]